MASMIDWMIRRREELRTYPQSVGRAVDVGTIGNRTTAHLNLTTPLQTAYGIDKRIIDMASLGIDIKVVAEVLKIKERRVKSVCAWFGLGN